VQVLDSTRCCNSHLHIGQTIKPLGMEAIPPPHHHREGVCTLHRREKSEDLPPHCLQFFNGSRGI